MQAVGFGEPVRCACGQARPCHPVARPASAPRLPPITPDGVVAYRAPAAMARDARGSIRPPQPACPPSPRLRDGPGQAPPPRVLHGLQWPAAPLGQRLAPDCALAVPRFATARRKAEHVDRPRLSLSTPLAPFDCEASQLDQPRLLRMQRSLDLAHTCPPCSPAPFGLIPVCEAHDASVGVAPAAHSPACVLPPPSVGPQGQDVVQGARRRPGAPPAPLGGPCLLRVPLPLCRHARLQPLWHGAEDALGPTPRREALQQPCVVDRIKGFDNLIPPSTTHSRTP